MEAKMTTFRRLKKLMELKKVPEPAGNFWDTYIPSLMKRIEIEPVPLFLRFRPIPLISFTLTTLVTFSVITTLTIYKPQPLELQSVPRTQVLENLTGLDNLITENFVPEDIIEEFLPKDMFLYGNSKNFTTGGTEFT